MPPVVSTYCETCIALHNAGKFSPSQLPSLVPSITLLLLLPCSAASLPVMFPRTKDGRQRIQHAGYANMCGHCLQQEQLIH